MDTSAIVHPWILHFSGLSKHGGYCKSCHLEKQHDSQNHVLLLCIPLKMDQGIVDPMLLSAVEISHEILNLWPVDVGWHLHFPPVASVGHPQFFPPLGGLSHLKTRGFQGGSLKKPVKLAPLTPAVQRQHLRVRSTLVGGWFVRHFIVIS